MIRAKFKVDSTTDYGNSYIKVEMTPVTTGSEENKSFSKYTPSGKLELHVTNPSVFDFFKAGKEYYLDFKQAE